MECLWDVTRTEGSSRSSVVLSGINEPCRKVWGTNAPLAGANGIESGRKAEPKAGNVLSTIGSQGFRKAEGFGPESTETGAGSFGNQHWSLNDASSRKVLPKGRNKGTAGWFCHNKQDRKARGCRNRS
jgi:hypothetical protein